MRIVQAMDVAQEPSSVGEAPKRVLRSLEQLCADFKQRQRYGRSGLSLVHDDAARELPSDNGSQCAEEVVDGECNDVVLRPLHQLQSDFDARRLVKKPAGKAAPKSSPFALPLATDAADDIGKEACCTPLRPCTGTLVKVIERRGFGFLLPDGEQHADVMLHCSQMARGNFRDMSVGMRVQYVQDTDRQTGRKRATNAVRMEEDDLERGIAEDQVHGAPTYNRDELVKVFAKIGRRIDRHPGLRLSAISFPTEFSSGSSCSSTSGSCCSNEEAADTLRVRHASLDDEYLIGKLEERLSKESGFDDMNEETFGESSGWSFEEAVAANARLAQKLDFGHGLSVGGVCSSTLASSTADSGSSAADCSPAERSGGPSRSESPDHHAYDCLEGDLPYYMLVGLQLQ